MSEEEIVSLRESQVCYVSDGFMFCNFVIRKNGDVIKGHNKMLRFPFRGIKNRLKRKIVARQGDDRAKLKS